MIGRRSALGGLGMGVVGGMTAATLAAGTSAANAATISTWPM